MASSVPKHEGVVAPPADLRGIREAFVDAADVEEPTARTDDRKRRALSGPEGTRGRRDLGREWFRPRAISRAGAKGLMQLMPHTAGRVGISERDLFAPAKT